jgi:hypothetical protein
MSTIISKTRYTFDVLHRTDEPPRTLEDALREADTGHMVGAVVEERTTDVPNDTVRTELLELGNDGSFFEDDVADAELRDALQDVADAAYGDSNDKEIELLREALDLTLSRLGVSMPEGHDPDAEDGGEPIPGDHAACVAAARHLSTQRHPAQECVLNERNTA